MDGPVRHQTSGVLGMRTGIQLSGIAFARYGEGHLSDFVFKTLFSRYNPPRECFCSLNGSKITWQVCGLIGLPNTCPYQTSPEGIIYDSIFTWTVAKSLSGLQSSSKPFVISKSPIGRQPITHFEGNLEWDLNGCESLPGIGWLVEMVENDFPPGVRDFTTAKAIRESAQNVFPEKDAVIGFVTEELVGAIEFRRRLDRTLYAVDIWAVPRVVDRTELCKPDELFFPLDETGRERILLGRLS